MQGDKGKPSARNRKRPFVCAAHPGPSTLAGRRLDSIGEGINEGVSNAMATFVETVITEAPASFTPGD